MKPLKFLLANNTLSMLAGSETYTYTLATALQRAGHFVSCFSPELGIIAKELGKKNIRSYSDFSDEVRPFTHILEEKVDHHYDVIIASHHHIVKFLRARFPKTPIISIIHGVIHFMPDEHGNPTEEWAPEHPALDAGVNQFIAVSKEVREKLQNDYHIDSVVLHNFFDIPRFEMKRVISPEKPKCILINTNYHAGHDPEVEIVRSVAKHYSAKLAAVGINFSSTFDITRALEDADIVLGMGRSVLEGVAAGRLGIVHGRWGTGGVVCEENIEELRHFNFSGRNSKGLMAAEEMISEIDKHYNQETIEWGKQYVKREHNADIAAETFIRIARELAEGPVATQSELRPYRRMSDVAKNS